MKRVVFCGGIHIYNIRTKLHAEFKSISIIYLVADVENVYISGQQIHLIKAGEGVAWLVQAACLACLIGKYTRSDLIIGL